MQQQLQRFGSLVYLYKFFALRKKSIWQENISSKEHYKERIYTIVKNILKLSIPMGLCSLLSATTKTIDALTLVRILKKIIGEKNATIQYGILTGKVDTLIMLPFSFNIAFAITLVPTVSNLIEKEQIKNAIQKIKHSILITALMGILCTVFMSMFSEVLIKILFPNAAIGGEMLKISSLSIVFVLLTQTINGALQGLGKVNTPVIAFAIGSIVKLILNLLLIPIYQVKGAIFSTVLSSIIIFLICFIKLKQCLKKLYFLRRRDFKKQKQQNACNV